MLTLSEDFWEMKETETRGRGIFAKKEIPGGTVIGDYLGRLVFPNDIKESTDFFFEASLSDKLSIMPDIQKPGVHIINHTCIPNCEVYPYKGHLIFFALRRIFPGEELGYSYGLPPPDYETEPCRHICTCNTFLCRGTMHTSFIAVNKWNELLQKNNSAYYQTMENQIGEQMKPLESYPETLDDNPFYDIFGNEDKPAQIVNENKVPEISELRKHIRETGKTLFITPLRLKIIGVMNGLVLSFIAP